MTVRRPFLRAAACAITVIVLGLLTACGPATRSTPSAAGGTAVPGTGTPAPVKTLPPSPLCTVLTEAVAERLIADARLLGRVSPNKGDAPDVCNYAAADGTSTLSLTPATRTYSAELSAAHDLSAHPAPAGMRDVRVDLVRGLGQQAFRETAYQTQAGQHITFVVWTSGAKTWVLTFTTTATSLTAPVTVPDDKVVQAARSITTGLLAHK